MRIAYSKLKAEFKRVLLKRNLDEVRAKECATAFADTSLAGVYSHGVNRFAQFISQIDAGAVKVDSLAEKILSLGAIEQWDAHQGIGNLTASQMMNRAMALATQYGIGVVALKNANHWMRGGSYGYQAAEKGFIGICWTNSLAVMPPWGAKECRIGTNPLVIAVPSSPITMVDMSCSLYSYGKLELLRLKGEPTAFAAGFDDEGNLTCDPATVEKNRRLLPMGYWKGSSLSIILDMIATLLANGKSTAQVSQEHSTETCVSQVFIAISLNDLIDKKERDEKLQQIIDYVLSAQQSDPNTPIRLPGHEVDRIKADNEQNGIPVDPRVWEVITSL